MFFENNFKNDFDIFFFLETHHMTEDEIPAEILRYGNTHHIIHSTATENEKYTGIIGLISKDYEIKNENHLIQGRILNIKIVHKKENKYIGLIFRHKQPFNKRKNRKYCNQTKGRK